LPTSPPISEPLALDAHGGLGKSFVVVYAECHAFDVTKIELAQIAL
jgi:hypothetical protein